MDRMLTLSESASIARVSYSKMLKLAKAGKIPFKKLGATWLIPQSVLYRELGMQLSEENFAYEKGEKNEH